MGSEYKMTKRRKEQVKAERALEKGKQRKRKRRRMKRAGRRQGRQRRKEMWCLVSSEATNTTVVRTWKKSKGHHSSVRNGRLGKSQKRAQPEVKGGAVIRQNVVRSAGNRGYKSVRHRGTDYAARKVVGRARKLCKRSRKQEMAGKVGVHLRREGTGKGSKARRKRVKEHKRKLRSVSDKTREAHNGCKGKKARRR